MRYKEMCYSNITTLLGKKLYNVLLLFLGGILPPPPSLEPSDFWSWIKI